MGEFREHNRALLRSMKGTEHTRYICCNERRAKRNQAPYVVDGSCPFYARRIFRGARTRMNIGNHCIEQGIHDPQRRGSVRLGKAILAKSNFPILISFGPEIRYCIVGAGYSETLVRLCRN